MPGNLISALRLGLPDQLQRKSSLCVVFPCYQGLHQSVGVIVRVFERTSNALKDLQK